MLCGFSERSLFDPAASQFDVCWSHDIWSGFSNGKLATVLKGRKFLHPPQSALHIANVMRICFFKPFHLLEGVCKKNTKPAFWGGHLKRILKKSTKPCPPYFAFHKTLFCKFFKRRFRFYLDKLVYKSYFFFD